MVESGIMKRPIQSAFATFLAISSAAIAAKEDFGTVIALRNRAEACVPANGCRKLDFGSRVANGDSLKTFADSRMTIRFPTGSRIDMGPNSVLVMVSMQADGKKTFARWGEFDFGKGRFQVRTPVAVAGAEGTKFHVEVDTATGESRLRLNEGVLSISPDDTRYSPFLMHSGDQLDMRFGMPPFLSKPNDVSSGTDIVPVPTSMVKPAPTSGTLHIRVGP